MNFREEDFSVNVDDAIAEAIRQSEELEKQRQAALAAIAEAERLSKLEQERQQREATELAEAQRLSAQLAEAQRRNALSLRVKQEEEAQLAEVLRLSEITAAKEAEKEAKKQESQLTQVSYRNQNRIVQNAQSVLTAQVTEDSGLLYRYNRLEVESRIRAEKDAEVIRMQADEIAELKREIAMLKGKAARATSSHTTSSHTTSSHSRPSLTRSQSPTTGNVLAEAAERRYAMSAQAKAEKMRNSTMYK